MGLLRAVDLAELPDKVPGNPLTMGSRGGDLSAAAAAELGFSPGIAVAMSGIDAHAGMVGMNVLTGGTLALITGTSTCQLAQSPNAVFDSGLWGPFESAVIDGDLIKPRGRSKQHRQDRSLGARPARRDTACRRGTLRGGRCRRTAAVAAGAEGLTLLDFWQGSRTPIKDPAARGTIWGLTPAHGPGHLLRAVYEGTAYGDRVILEKLKSLGVPTERIVACGGGTRSSLWLQILADVAGLPIHLPEVADATSLGTAMCAAVGAGAFPDLPAAGAAMVRLASTIDPDAVSSPVYDEGYDRYLNTYAALAPLFHAAQ